MISSRQNKQIKNLFKLLKKKHQDETNSFLVFGDHAIQEAKRAGFIIEIFTSNGTKEGTLISPEIMKELSTTETPFDNVAVVKKGDIKPYTNKILMLDGVQDPGNVGSLIRSAIGFNFNTIIRSNDSASFYNDKTVRATQGNIFYANLISADLKSEIIKLKELQYKIIATTLEVNSDISALKKHDKIVVILGSEGSGISTDILSLCEYRISIPTTQIESLNVMAAGSIIMYELRE